MTIIDELVAVLGFEIKNEQDLKKFQKDLDHLEKRFYNFGAAVRKAALWAGAAFAGGAGFLGKGVIDTSAEFEKYQATLETIEGTAEKARKAMDWVADFAKTTPYEVNELTDAFVKLKAYGLDPMDGTMTVIGDTASAMNKSLNQAVEAWADAITGEFERMKEFGMKAKQAKGMITFTWQEGGKEMTKTLKNNAKEIQKFLNETMGRKFAGAMERQSETWSGMMSTMKDAWTDFKRRIGDAGFFDVVKRKLKAVLVALDDASKDGTVTMFSTFLSKAFINVADAVGIAFDRIKTHLKFISQNWDKFEPWVKGITAALILLALAAYPVASGFALAALALDDLLTYMEGGESVIGEFSKNWKSLALEVDADFSKNILSIKNAIDSLASTLANALLDEIGWEGKGATVGERILNGLKQWGGQIKDWFASLFQPPSWLVGATGSGAAALAGSPNIQSQVENWKRLNAGIPGVVKDAARAGTTNNVQVNAPISMQVQQATQAPAAAAGAVQGAVKSGLQPSRMQSGPQE